MSDEKPQGKRPRKITKKMTDKSQRKERKNEEAAESDSPTLPFE